MRGFFSCLITLCLVAPAFTASGRQAQPGGDQTRDFGFFSRFRPKGKKPQVKKPVYKRIGPAVTNAADDAAIGVTLWHARPATKTDPVATRDIVQKDDGTKTELVLARVGGETALDVGQEFRIGVETVRTGYLYVVNRPIRPEGGASYLIFPTRGIRRGDNRVRAGRMVMLPTPPGEEPFEIRDDRGDLTAEELIVIVTPKPLDVETREGRYELPRETVDGWIAQWGAPSETYEMEGGAGAAYTAAEKAAASVPGRVLTASDAAPQFVHRIAAKPGDSLLVRFTVRVRRAGAN